VLAALLGFVFSVASSCKLRSVSWWPVAIDCVEHCEGCARCALHCGRLVSAASHANRLQQQLACACLYWRLIHAWLTVSGCCKHAFSCTPAGWLCQLGGCGVAAWAAGGSPQ
jgi:hypothetical protein